MRFKRWNHIDKQVLPLYLMITNLLVGNLKIISVFVSRNFGQFFRYGHLLQYNIDLAIGNRFGFKVHENKYYTFIW